MSNPLLIPPLRLAAIVPVVTQSMPSQSDVDASLSHRPRTASEGLYIQPTMYNSPSLINSQHSPTSYPTPLTSTFTNYNYQYQEQIQPSQYSFNGYNSYPLQPQAVDYSYRNNSNIYIQNHNYAPLPLPPQPYPSSSMYERSQPQVYYQPEASTSRHFHHYYKEEEPIYSPEAPSPDHQPVETFSRESTLTPIPDTPQESQSSETSSRPFIVKLGNILDESAAYGDTICWDKTGTIVLIFTGKLHNKLTQTILPNFFSHSSVAALHRQFNLYEFTHLSRKQTTKVLLSSPPPSKDVLPRSWRAWKHDGFTREDVSTRPGLSPKPSLARRQLKQSNLLNQKVKQKKKMGWDGISQAESKEVKEEYEERDRSE